jgi:uroporphyrinogen decarboxylase
LNKRERVLKTLNIEEPDMVPITEMDIEIPLMETIMGKKFPATTSLQTQVVVDKELEKKSTEFRIECYQKLDFDLILTDLSAPEGWEPKVDSEGKMVDLWGRILALDKQTRAWVPYDTIFKSPEDFDNFELPNPDAQGWTLATEHTKKILEDKFAIAAFIRDPFAHSWEMFTPLNFVRWTYQNPQVIKKAIEKIADFNIEIIKRMAEIGADLIISGGDYCEEKGPMVPIKFFDDVIFPNLKRQVEAAHKKGMKLIKHTDGNINPLLESLSNIVDGLHSLDPTAGVDIGKVKERYGDRLVLIGNIAVDSLAKKNKEEIILETKNVIQKASPGGGHIISSSNSWASGAKLENCLTMVKTAREHGKYPIKV